MAAFDDRRLELLPTLSSSSRQGRHELAVDNHGNAPIRPAFVALDPEDQLRFEIDPSVLTVEPGAAGFTTVKVRPKQRFWRGQPKRLPFQIVAAEDGHDPVTTDGALLQQPRLAAVVLEGRARAPRPPPVAVRALEDAARTVDRIDRTRLGGGGRGRRGGGDRRSARRRRHPRSAGRR